MRVKYNNKHWVVTKSLKDFAQLNVDLANEYTKLNLPVNSALLEDKDEKGTKEEKIVQKQRNLEDYLRVNHIQN